MTTAAAAAPIHHDFKGQTAVILGVTGIVGQGAAYRFLEAGGRVIGVGRDKKKLDALVTLLGKLVTKDNWASVVGHFGDEKASAATYAAVSAVAKGGYQHVISNLGFVNTSTKGASESPLSEVKQAFEDSFYPTFLAATVFLPPLKAVANSSYTINSGGFSHFTPAPTLWPATIKNAALNAYGLTLFKEYENAAVRVNVCCIHMGVAEIGGSKNQLGFPSGDTRRLGPTLLSIAASKSKGKQICLNTMEDAEAVAHSILK